MLYLTDHFESPLGRVIGSSARGAYLSWLFYYGNVAEPVLYAKVLDIADDPAVHDWCRDTNAMFQAMETALSRHAYLVDDQISAADVLMASPLMWFPDVIPDNKLIKDWIDRCGAAQDSAYIEAFEAKAIQQLGLPNPAQMAENG